MKKYKFSDNSKSKSSKGFYAALGISAAMIGSACLFAYNQGEKLDSSKLTAEISQASEAAVDKKTPDVPRQEDYSPVKPKQTTVPAATTAPPQTTTAAVTVPAAAIATSPPSQTITKESEPSNPMFSAPLADMNNIINTFSGKELVKNSTTGSWQTHNGVDIAAAVGNEVYSAAPGEVSAVNNDPLWGVTVTIDHLNGYLTKYCGLAADLNVQQGDTVKAGDSIGAVGNTADIESALDSHLHFELIHNGNYENPLSFIK